MLRVRAETLPAILITAAILMTLGGTSCSAGSAPSSAGTVVAPTRPLPAAVAASIWFQPIPAAAAWPNGPTTGVGSTDFLSLFEADAPWQKTLAHSGVTLEYLARLKAFGGKLTFVKVDEPLYFGSYVADPRSCHLPVSEVARQVGAYVRLVKSVYPDAQVGDVEPIIARGGYVPDVATAIAQWFTAYQARNGAALPFFIADPDYGNPSWPTLVESLEATTRASAIRFGVIYMGDPPDTSDAQWTAKADARFRTYEQQNGGKPDIALFQSWMQQPKHVLPETDPTSFTGVLAAYIDAQ